MSKKARNRILATDIIPPGNDKKVNYDVVLKVVSSILALITLIAGLAQYIKNSEREFRKQIYTEQIRVYIETSEVVAILANTEKEQIATSEYESARKRFFELKYGKLYLLQDTTVEKAFVEFTYVLNRYERKDPDLDLDKLRIKALELNQAFRVSIQNTWGINLSTLNRGKDDIIH